MADAMGAALRHDLSTAKGGLTPVNPAKRRNQDQPWNTPDNETGKSSMPKSQKTTKIRFHSQHPDHRWIQV